MPKYFYVQTINEIDLLGEYISLDLAVELLKECIFDENIEDMKNMIFDEDFKIYWYTYVSELLSNFYQENKQIKEDEKKIIVDYLRALKEYPILIVSSKAEKSDTEIKMIEDSSKKLIDLKNEVNHILNLIQIYRFIKIIVSSLINIWVLCAYTIPNRLESNLQLVSNKTSFIYLNYP